MRYRTWPSEARIAAEHFQVGEVTEAELEGILVGIDYFPPGMDDEFQGIHEDTGTILELQALAVIGFISLRTYKRVIERLTTARFDDAP